jgi:hypothetical protein
MPRNYAAEEAEEQGTESAAASTALDFMVDAIWNNFPGIQELITAEELAKKPEAEIVKLFTKLTEAPAEQAAPAEEEVNAAAESVQYVADPAVTNEVKQLRAALDTIKSQLGNMTAESIRNAAEAKLAEARLPQAQENFVRNLIKNGTVNNIDQVILDAKNASAEMGILGGLRSGEAQDDKMADGLYHMMFQTMNPTEKKYCAEAYGKDYSDRKYRMFSGPKDMYLSWVGGRELGHGFGMGARGATAESAHADQLTQIAGDAMHRRMIIAYRAAEGWDDFQKLVRWVPVNDFKAWHAQNFGYFRNPLSTITKGNDYPEISISGDQDVLLTLVEQGGMFTINWVDMVNDNLDFFTRVPAEMGKGAKKQLYKAVFDRLKAGKTTTWQDTGYNEFSTDLGTAYAAGAITGARISAMDILLNQQTDLAGEIMGLASKYLIAPLSQKTAVYPIVTPASGVNNMVATADQSIGLEPIYVKHWGNSDNTYAIAADPADIEGLTILAYQGNQEPQIVQEMAETGKSFTAKQVRFRLEHHWKVGLTENRGYVLSTLS